ncbi:hypothetical protein RCL1_003269 [Eukaryota sp. TZLM3-RCL]
MFSICNPAFQIPINDDTSSDVPVSPWFDGPHSSLEVFPGPSDSPSESNDNKCFLVPNPTAPSLPPHVCDSISMIPNLYENLDSICRLLFDVLTNNVSIVDLSLYLPPQLYKELSNLLTSLLTDCPEDAGKDPYVPFFSLPSVNEFPLFKPSSFSPPSDSLPDARLNSGFSSPMDNRVSPIPVVTRPKKWTPEEDQLIIQYVTLEGTTTAFRTLSDLLNRREDSIRSHWERVLNPDIKKGHWSPAEDRLLLECIKACGGVESNKDINWKDVAEGVPRRTDGQCRYRYERILKPALAKARGEQVIIKETKRDEDRRKSRKGSWTKEEDALLRQAVDEFGIGNWKLIATKVKTRTDQQCLRHYAKCLDPNIKKGRWEHPEDVALVKAVSTIGEGRWSEVARYVSNRTDKQIHLRYQTLKKKYGDGIFRSFGCAPAQAFVATSSSNGATPSEEYDEYRLQQVAQAISSSR